MYPKNQYADFIEKKLNKMKLGAVKTFRYSPDPQILTGEIETLTNYSQRKKNLELRKKILEDKDEKQSLKEFSNDITLKELYYKIKVNKLINYQIFRNENDGISDTLLLFARGESLSLIHI